MTTTTTNGQKPVYNGIGVAPEPPKDRVISELIPPKMPEDRLKTKFPVWLTVLIFTVLIGVAIISSYQVGKSDGITQEQTKQAYEAKKSEITSVTNEKKQDGITEREKSKSSAEHAQIIRNGIIRELPVIKDTTRGAKDKWLRELINTKRN